MTLKTKEMSGLFVNAKFGKPASIKLSLQAQTRRFRVCKWVHDIAGGKQAMVDSQPEKDRHKGDAFLTMCVCNFLIGCAVYNRKF